MFIIWIVIILEYLIFSLNYFFVIYYIVEIINSNNWLYMFFLYVFFIYVFMNYKIKSYIDIFIFLL